MKKHKIEILGSRTIESLKRTHWFRHFTTLDPLEQQPWVDGVICWLEQNADKHNLWQELSIEEKNEAILIIAAGHYEKDFQVYRQGWAPCRLHSEDATGWCSQAIQP